MIIVGDIATGTDAHTKYLKEVFDSNINIFGGKMLLCNFEGLLNVDALVSNTPVLMNHPSVIPVLRGRGPVIAALANNHTLDIAQKFADTINIFKKNDIQYLGAGNSPAEASNSLTIKENSKEAIVFNACWDFLLYNQKNPTNGTYVSIIDELAIIKKVSEVRVNKPAASIIVYLHWNFDLETLPFPMHRLFAKALIDAGANVVAGAHSHCVQGGEKYKDGYIVYGLGNFFLPHNFFANGKVSYPKFADTELVLEWDFVTNKAICHWFDYKYNGKEHTQKHLGSEIFEQSERLKKYSPYQEMSHKEYIKYFKKKRRKKILIPVYTDFNNFLTNRIYTFLLKKRAKIARILAKNNFIKWQH